MLADKNVCPTLGILEVVRKLIIWQDDCMSRILFVILLTVSPGVVEAEEPAANTGGFTSPARREEELREAVVKALPLLEKGAVGHREQRTCFSCHNQGVPIVAITTARSRGIAVNDEELARQLKFITDFLATNRERFLEGKGTGGQVDTAGYALLALESGGWKSDDNTSAVAEYLLLFQNDADHWKNSSHRPPSEASELTTNYLGLRGLASYGTESQQERIAARREQVRSWLQKAEAKETEDHVFRMWSLKLLEEPSETIAAAVDSLRKLQRDNGGWSQLPEMDSDAYATGSVLVALHQAGDVATSDPAYQRGLEFLLKTQQDDGSWQVTSRSKPFQKYFETGFPHGKDQFISAAASAWATTALALALPHEVEDKKEPQINADDAD